MTLLRLATSNDLDDLVDMYATSSLQDPIVTYIIPAWQHDRAAMARNGRRLFEDFLAKDDIVINVIEHAATHRSVAVAIWRLPPPRSSLMDNSGPKMEAKEDEAEEEEEEPLPPDAVPARLTAHREAAKRITRDVFDAKYGKDGQLHLRLMLCAVGHQRQGYGRMLMEWGIEKAKTERLGLTLFASPMGEALYRSMGMVKMCRMMAHIEGEEGEREFGPAYEFDGRQGGNMSVS